MCEEVGLYVFLILLLIYVMGFFDCFDFVKWLVLGENLFIVCVVVN